MSGRHGGSVPAARPRARRALFVFLILFVSSGYFFPRWGRTDWAASARADLVFAVADRGVLHIDDYHENTGDKALYAGHYYAVGSIGPSLLALPAYLAVRPLLDRVRSPDRRERLALYAMTLFAVSLPAALLGVAVYAFACRFASGRSAFVLALVYGLGTVAFPYSKALFQHQVSAFGLFVGFYLLWRVVREGATGWRVPVAGALFGLAAISEYPVALFAGLVFLWAVAEARDRRALAGVVLGGLPLLLLLAAYDYAIFGTPFPVGYRYHVEYHGMHARGFMGIAEPRWDALVGVTVSPYRGLFWLSPVLLLALPGLRRLWRTAGERRTAALLAAVIAGFLLYVGSYGYWWGGDAIGPRFLVPAVPFLVLAVAAAIDDWLARPVTLGVFTGLTAWSLINVWAQSVAGQQYPPYEFRGAVVTNPTFQWAIPLLREGDVARNIGHLLGLQGIASVLPLLALLGLLLVAAREGRGGQGIQDPSLRPG